jgi:hypothetical protein
MRSDDTEQYRPIRSLLRRLINAPTILAVLWPCLLVVGGYVGWSRWGQEHVTARFERIDPTRIQVTEPPEHVRSNIVKAVYRDTAMESLSLLDRQAAAKIASAFSMHPWVRNVSGVRKLPGGAIDVRLEYRVPVAMVHVFKPDPNDKSSYFLPVDGEGVLLPTSEFSPADTRRFIHIEVPHTYSTNAFVGSPFGDTRVEYAARIAQWVQPFRAQAGLLSVGILGDPRQTDIPQYEIIKQDGTRFPWGSPPGFELPGELTASMKLRALLADSMGGGADVQMATPHISTPPPPRGTTTR